MCPSCSTGWTVRGKRWRTDGSCRADSSQFAAGLGFGGIPDLAPGGLGGGAAGGYKGRPTAELKAKLAQGGNLQAEQNDGELTIPPSWFHFMKTQSQVKRSGGNGQAGAGGQQALAQPQASAGA